MLLKFRICYSFSLQMINLSTIFLYLVFIYYDRLAIVVFLYYGVKRDICLLVF